MVDTEFEAGVFKHREVSVSKTTVTSDVPNAAMPDGEQISFSAVANDFLVSTTGVTKDETNKLIDDALDQKIKRAPLAGSSLITAHIKLMALLDKLVPFGNPLATMGDEAPNDIYLTVQRKGGSLSLVAELK